MAYYTSISNLGHEYGRVMWCALEGCPAVAMGVPVWERMPLLLAELLLSTPLHKTSVIGPTGHPAAIGGIGEIP